MQSNEQQRKAIEHTDGPLLIIAGAGTGKTRVIVEKIGYLLDRVKNLEPQNILALTFSDKAAKEMEERAAARWQKARFCRFSTFHAFCLELLFKEASWKPLDQFDHWIFLRRKFDSLGLDHYLHLSEPARFLSDLLDFCSRCHDNLVTPQNYAAHVERVVERLQNNSSTPPEKLKLGKRNPKVSTQTEIAEMREVARVFARSEELQEAASLVSFGGMITRAASMLENSPDLLARLQRRYRYILVDEFQDTNSAQIEILKMLASKSQNISVVGDPNQAIYHFRGASYTSFKQFEDAFRGHERVELSENYRSTQQILTVAKTMISFSSPDPRQPDPRPLKAAKEHPNGRKVEVLEFISEIEQAEFLARQIRAEVQSGASRYSDCAVLYRNHSHRDHLVAALRRSGVPFSIRKLDIKDYAGIKDSLAFLRAIGDPHDNVSLLRVLKHTHWNIEPGLTFELCRAARKQHLTLSDAIRMKLSENAGLASPRVQPLRTLVETLERCRKRAEAQRIGEWLESLRQEIGLFAKQQEELFWKTFAAFVLTWDTEKSSTGKLAEFLEYFSYFEEAGGTINLPEEDAQDEAATSPNEGSPPQPAQGDLWPQQAERRLGKVQLMTIHAAKGLEFGHVFLLHLVQGALPNKRRSPLISFPDELIQGPQPQGDVHIEEERRLFYVALTRAKDTLTLCTLSNAKKHPSKFLEELRNSNCDELTWRQVPPCGDLGPPRRAPQPWIPPEAAITRENLVLSASGLEMYLECPLKYYYSYIWQVPGSSSAALQFGSMMHSAVKKLVQSLASDRQMMSSATIESILREQWFPTAFTDAAQEQKYWRSGIEQLEGVWRTHAAKPFTLLFQERTFQFVWGSTKVKGRIDQINRLAGKDIELVEYKTGRAQTQKDADSSRQLTIYAHACREVLELEPKSVVLYNLAAQELIETTRGKQDFQEVEEELHQASTSILNGNFSSSPGYHCRNCDFRLICPAHEDTGSLEVSPPTS